VHQIQVSPASSKEHQTTVTDFRAVAPTDDQDAEGEGFPIFQECNSLLKTLLQDLARGKIYLNDDRRLVPLAQGRKTASWRHMFLMQPPVTRVTISCIFRDHRDDWVGSFFSEIVESEDGVKAGDIVERMQKRQDQMEVRKDVCARI